ncbi:MAG: hypothetical protein WBP79_10005 [Candidatus Acidiferrales bacterium]
MHTAARIAAGSALIFLLAHPANSFAQEKSQPDPAMNHRGEHVMGFSQEKTTHHFFLAKDGGAIQVQVNDGSDIEIRNHIRMHLQQITKAFAAGDFEDPMEVHDQIPPGVPAMQRLKGKIHYHYRSIARGGRVQIRSNDSEAVEALHQYLRFQIQEHKTGDPVATP